MNKKKILFTLYIILFGVILRLFLNKEVGIPNFEAVTALSLVSGSFFGGFLAVMIPLFVIFLSDIFFGNTSVYIFTWSAFVAIGFLGSLLKRGSKRYTLKITSLGLFSVLLFYLWTNLGWWLTSNMYQMTLGGLIECYIAALPFLKNQLYSVLIFTPCFSYLFSFVFDNFLTSKKIENRKFLGLKKEGGILNKG